MKIVEQLSLFLLNQPGTLAAVCDALAEAKVNIYGLSVADAADHAVVRMVVSDPRKALHIFEAHGTLAVESDVLLIENENRPGMLSRIARKLARRRAEARTTVPSGAAVAEPSRAKEVVRASDLKELLGTAPYDPSLLTLEPKVGVATGLLVRARERQAEIDARRCQRERALEHLDRLGRLAGAAQALGELEVRLDVGGPRRDRAAQPHLRVGEAAGVEVRHAERDRERGIGGRGAG